MLILLPLLGVLFNGLTTAHVEANLSLEFKATKLLRQHNPANCTVGNTTYVHGQTFKLDCKTQCVCENGRHACSSLCPKEQLPAPEDTMSCRSPRLVEVPGHCCKMWLCENPTADVYATCHNASTSPWTPCSQPCGLGISTRFTSTNTGCRQLSSLRLCENRKCDQDNNSNKSNNRNYSQPQQAQIAQKATTLQQKHAKERRQQQLISHNAAASNLVVSEPKDTKDITNYHVLFEHEEHRIRKGHECRNLQRLGPARIRLGACISRKLYRPKLCGRCHHHSGKCCTPSVSTTIQVELLCPLNAVDPISFAEEQQQREGQTPLQLWDTVSLEPIDQEFLQSHQIQIENKFIAVEWILKCECNKNENCNNLQKYTATMLNSTGNNSSNGRNNSTQQNNNSSNNKRSNNNGNGNWHISGVVGDRNNSKNAATNIANDPAYNYNEYAYNSNNNNHHANTTSSGHNKGSITNIFGNSNNEQNIAADNGSVNRNVQQQLDQEEDGEATQQEQQQYLVSSGELQPDIIPYPAMLPPHRHNQEANGAIKNNNNSNKNEKINYDNQNGVEDSFLVDEARGGVNGDGMRTGTEHDSNNNNIKRVESDVVPNTNIFVASFGFYDHDGDDEEDNAGIGHTQDDVNGSDEQQRNALEVSKKEEQQHQQQQQQYTTQQQWEVEKNLHYQQQERATSKSDKDWQQNYQQQQHSHQHPQHHHHLDYQHQWQHSHQHQNHLHPHQHHHHHHHHHQHSQSYPYPHSQPPQSQQHSLEPLQQEQEPRIEQHAFSQRRT